MNELCYYEKTALQRGYLHLARKNTLPQSISVVPFVHSIRKSEGMQALNKQLSDTITPFQDPCPRLIMHAKKSYI